MKDLESEAQLRELAKRIAGEIVLSPNPGNTIRKWRNLLKISQIELARELGITPSVISDYESNRRKSPGIRMIKKIVDALLNIEYKRGGKILKEFFIERAEIVNAILDLREFIEPVSVKEFCKIIGARLVTDFGGDDEVFGYTVIDSVTAILELSPQELVKIYGSTTQRALIFTHITGGKSPLVAIKVTGFKPSLVVLHGTSSVDEIAKKIAEVERIPLAISSKVDVESLISNLRKSFT